MGGDRGPEEIVAGALAAASDRITPVLVGPQGLDTHGLELIEAPDAIAMDEKPTEAVRAKPQSSLVVACSSVGEGRTDAVVSAGNTGAMLAACLLELRRLSGVRRPGIAVTIPAQHGPSVLIDSGANADARPEDLVQFAHMGVVFAEEILGIREPKVRLLSIGEEGEKGNHLTLEAHDLLARSDLPFAGNTEGRDILLTGSNVVVTDGFTGNVALKTMEGLANMLVGAVKTEYTRNPLRYVGAMASWPVLRSLRREFDPRTYNGASMVGLTGIVIKSHGSADTLSFCNAIRVGLIEARKGVPTQIGNLLRAQLS